MSKPYVVSAELDLPNTRIGQIINTKDIETFRVSLSNDLSAMDKDVVWVSSSTIKDGIERAIALTKLPTLSLDDRYTSSADNYLGISRGINEQLEDVGYVPRVGYSKIANQLNQLVYPGKEVVLVDDVLFSGEMISWISNKLAKIGTTVTGLICGVAISEGVERLRRKNIDVEAVISFEEVEDEICERDFAVVPGSGRRISETSSNAIYFDPINGKPNAWASIPKNDVNTFASNSYMRSANLIANNINIEDIGNFRGLPNGNAKQVMRKFALTMPKNSERGDI